jgi:hypothetical protein
MADFETIDRLADIIAGVGGVADPAEIRKLLYALVEPLKPGEGSHGEYQHIKDRKF